MEARQRRPRVYRERADAFNDYDDTDFLRRYRFDMVHVRFLVNMFITAGYGRKDGRGYAIDDELMVLTGLKFFASGSMYVDIADSHGVSRSTVVRGVKRLAQLLCECQHEWIKLPNTAQELFRTAQGFQMFGMPRCVGALDGLHIEMIAPARLEGLYVNRHFKHSMNLQACCDANMLFTWVDPSWPGSTHDSYALNNSAFGTHCTLGNLGNYFVLGDSGYAQKPWLLTPILRPAGQGELRYNVVHKHSRSVIERAFGRIKMRFRCLSKTGGIPQTTPEKVTDIIMACCVLHNMAELAKLPLPAEDDVAEFVAAGDEMAVDDGDEQDRAPLNNAGRQVREALVQNLFM